MEVKGVCKRGFIPFFALLLLFLLHLMFLRTYQHADNPPTLPYHGVEHRRSVLAMRWRTSSAGWPRGADAGADGVEEEYEDGELVYSTYAALRVVSGVPYTEWGGRVLWRFEGRGVYE
jgi:hypothetical protein